MTQTFPVQTSQTTAFQFQPTLDGTTYTCTLTWNVYGQRYYVTVSTTQGVLIVNLPLIGSPPDYDIDILAGYFTSKMVYYPATNTIVVTP